MRFKPGVEGPEGVEVLLISSRKGKGHVFPKGGWEEDEGLSEAAMRETVEEAGVRGELEVGAAPSFAGGTGCCWVAERWRRRRECGGARGGWVIAVACWW